MASVLLVDDEVIVRVAVRRMLESAGIEVAEAINAAEAMRIFRNRQADVILCDLFMPGKDGLELIQELRREFPSIPIIAMSGGLLKGTVDLLPGRTPTGLRQGAEQALHPGRAAGRDPRADRAPGIEFDTVPLRLDPFFFSGL